MLDRARPPVVAFLPMGNTDSRNAARRGKPSQPKRIGKSVEALRFRAIEDRIARAAAVNPPPPDAPPPGPLQLLRLRLRFFIELLGVRNNGITILRMESVHRAVFSSAAFAAVAAAGEESDRAMLEAAAAEAAAVAEESDRAMLEAAAAEAEKADALLQGIARDRWTAFKATARQKNQLHAPRSIGKPPTAAALAEFLSLDYCTPEGRTDGRVQARESWMKFCAGFKSFAWDDSLGPPPDDWRPIKAPAKLPPIPTLDDALQRFPLLVALALRIEPHLLDGLYAEWWMRPRPSRARGIESGGRQHTGIRHIHGGADLTTSGAAVSIEGRIHGLGSAEVIMSRPWMERAKRHAGQLLLHAPGEAVERLAAPVAVQLEIAARSALNDDRLTRRVSLAMLHLQALAPGNWAVEIPPRGLAQHIWPGARLQKSHAETLLLILGYLESRHTFTPVHNRYPTHKGQEFHVQRLFNKLQFNIIEKDGPARLAMDKPIFASVGFALQNRSAGGWYLSDLNGAAQLPTALAQRSYLFAALALNRIGRIAERGGAARVEIPRRALAAALDCTGRVGKQRMNAALRACCAAGLLEIAERGPMIDIGPGTHLAAAYEAIAERQVRARQGGHRVALLDEMPPLLEAPR